MKNQKEKRPSLAHTLEEFEDAVDILHRSFPEIQVEIIYFGHLIGNEEFERDVHTPLLNIKQSEIERLFKQSQFTKAHTHSEVIDGILKGQVAIFHGKQVHLIDVYGPVARAVTQSEQETVITGPHDAFVESSGPNLSLIRRRLKTSHLKVIKLSVGELSKTDVFLLYIKDIADMEMLQELKDRIEDIEVDAMIENTVLVQLIDEFPNSIFPQFLTTERPDVAVAKLADGGIVCIVDNSPTVVCAPTSFFDFFSSPDDDYQRWPLATATRLMRFLAFFITVGFTALYVSITTFHYEMVPEALLLNLTESRARVPFPPIYEALIMEVVMELLREAGARLPSKIGQTIGIVGGIVIGQAAVQAGLTSNILIIAVAISAIASFSIPSYMMSGAIRLIRFGLIILAGVLGNFGLLFGLTLITLHLCSLTSLGTSYLIPLAPFFLEDWKNTFIRGAYWSLRRRPEQTKTVNKDKNKMKR
ncbi:tetrahydromethanopterin S-methyltransferase subunit G [Bacillus horti]|uniref:Tetrahydromethanopterin S-methyltransferase subunit G n=2 Tax=Caldalkalibacillus horti TaxID=77523 RepID=A0ABT9VX26_9BACI|nr:tetrahydromethanopterin S-methyltransferase subunit G [Bacillus horti]